MPPVVAERELKYRVKFDADTSALQESLRKVTQQTDQVIAKAHQVFLLNQNGVGGKFVSPNANAAGGGGDPAGAGAGASAALAGVAAKVAAAAAAVQVFAGLLDAVTKLGNESATARDKILNFTDAIPLIGSSLTSLLGNAFDMVERSRLDGWFESNAGGEGRKRGRRANQYTRRFGGVGRGIADEDGSGAFAWMTDKVVAAMFTDDQMKLMGLDRGQSKDGTWQAMQKRMRESPFDRGRMQAEFGRRTRVEDLQMSDAGLRESAINAEMGVGAVNAIRFQPDIVKGVPQFLGAAGRFDYDDGYDNVIRQAKIAQIGAQTARNDARGRAGDAATSEMEQRQRTSDAERRSGAAMVDAERAYAEAKNTPDKENEFRDKVRQADIARTQYAQELARHEQTITRAKETALEVARSESAVRKANIAIAQAELQVVEAKIGKTKGNLEQFGMYDPSKQRAVVEAMERAQKGGFDSLSPEQKGLLSGTGFTADYARKASRESVEDSDVTKRLMTSLGQQDLKTLEAEKTRLQGQINLEAKIDAEKFREEVEKQLSAGLGKLLANTIGEIMRVQLDQIKLQFIQSNISRRP